MIVYRRRTAIESGASILLATDIAPGDTVSIRRPGESELTANPVTGVQHVGHGLVRLDFATFSHETSVAMPLRVLAFTAGSWRQVGATG